MFDAEIVVFQCTLFVFGLGQDLAQPGGDVELAWACSGPLYLRQFCECLFYCLMNRGKRQPCLFEERGCETSVLFQERKQKVLYLNPLMTSSRGMGRRSLERLL